MNHMTPHGVMALMLCVTVMTAATQVMAADDLPRATLIESRKIWDQAPHNAFTDLVRFKDRWWCVFREGKGHVSPDGALRVIQSKDGTTWESAALIKSTDSDLRDAKISITPTGSLMLTGDAAMHQGPIKHQSRAWFSADGTTWSDGVDIGDADNWLWRVTWHKGHALGIGYSTINPRGVRLYASQDGKTYVHRVQDLKIEGYPNESSIIFREDDTAVCLLRRDPQSGMLGTAKPPYTQWHWRDTSTRIGGPHMIQSDDGKLLAVVRLYDNPVRTSLCHVDAATGKITELLKLPSGGDTSYAGLVWHEKQLWISYYSSHEKKTSIYLARVKVEM